MVLQRAPQPSIVWGYADSFDTPITLTLNNKMYHTRTSSSPANELGESMWSTLIGPQPDEGPFDVKVKQPLPNETFAIIALHDILFGDVWVCSGQSNMAFTVSGMYNGSVEIANAAKYPKIRLFTAAKQTADSPQEELLGIALNWSLASAASVGSSHASAVCWLYGRMIHTELGGRPIGLIHSSWGGTPIELWSPPVALKACDVVQ
jgi:sialate O-acetylesterase